MPGVSSRRPGSLQRLEMPHQGVRAEAQPDVQHRRPVFDQQVAVAAGAVGDRDAVRAGVAVIEQRRAECDRLDRDGGFAQRRNRRVLFARQGVRAALVHGHEAHPVAGAQLAQLPLFGADDGRGTDEAAEAGAVRPEYHRHVAGVIHRADGVGVVVDVGGMQTGLAAIRARPSRLRPDQADAGAAGVVMDLPVRREKVVHVRRGEEIRRAVGPVDHRQDPAVLVSRPL